MWDIAIQKLAESRGMTGYTVRGWHENVPVRNNAPNGVMQHMFSVSAGSVLFLTEYTAITEVWTDLFLFHIAAVNVQSAAGAMNTHKNEFMLTQRDTTPMTLPVNRTDRYWRAAVGIPVEGSAQITVSAANGIQYVRTELVAHGYLITPFG